jgi:hypothetical protein
MNASFAFGAAMLFSLSAFPAHALTTLPQTFGAGSNVLISNADFVQGHEVVAGVPARQSARAEMSKAMSERYFDVDMIVTLGALALASGAFVAAGVAGGRRRTAEKAAQPREGWRDEVMQALETDLAQFTFGLRQAA